MVWIELPLLSAGTSVAFLWHAHVLPHIMWHAFSVTNSTLMRMQTQEERAIFNVLEAHAAAKSSCHKLATLLEKRILSTSREHPV